MAANMIVEIHVDGEPVDPAHPEQMLFDQVNGWLERHSCPQLTITDQLPNGRFLFAGTTVPEAKAFADAVFELAYPHRENLMVFVDSW
jgi:hypothetical protein